MIPAGGSVADLGPGQLLLAGGTAGCLMHESCTRFWFVIVNAFLVVIVNAFLVVIVNAFLVVIVNARALSVVTVFHGVCAACFTVCVQEYSTGSCRCRPTR